MNRQELIDAYEAFVAREPEEWYFALKRYTEFLQLVTQRLREDDSATTLESAHIPAADDLGIGDGDVDAFLDRLWRQQDNRVSNIGQGMFMHTEWRSLNAFTAEDGSDLRSLTREVMLDPAGAARTHRIHDFLEQWRSNDPTSPNMRWQVLWRVLAAVDPEHTTTVVAKPRLRKLAKRLGISKPSKEWYDLNQQVLDQLPPTEDLSLRRVAAWHLITVMEADEKRESAPAEEFVWTIPNPSSVDGAWPAALRRPHNAAHVEVIEYVIDRVRSEGFDIVTSPEHATHDAPEFRIRRDGNTLAWFSVSGPSIHLTYTDHDVESLPDGVRMSLHKGRPRLWLGSVDDATRVLDFAIPEWIDR